jgi:hypothetical protein
MMYPGLSPGHAFGQRPQTAESFLAQSMEFALSCDCIGVHAYWSQKPQYPIQAAVAEIDYYIGVFGRKPLWVTEASNNERDVAVSSQLRAVQYATFWSELKRRPSVQGVTYFVASASAPTFSHESWIDGRKQSKGIAPAIRQIVQT